VSDLLFPHHDPTGFNDQRKAENAGENPRQVL
jgi:hypothetical protein